MLSRVRENQKGALLPAVNTPDARRIQGKTRVGDRRPSYTTLACSTRIGLSGRIW